MDAQKILDVSWTTIVKVAIAVIAFYVLYIIKDILVWFIFALIISLSLNPIIEFLQRRKIPRILAVVSVYFIIFGVFALLIWMMIPIFSAEVRQFIQSFPEYFERISPALRGIGLEAFNNIESFAASIEGTLNAMSGNIFSFMFVVFGGILSTIFVVTTAIFISADEKIIERTLILIFPRKYENSATNIWKKSQKKVSGWFLARILVCVFVGLASYIMLLIFNVKYPVVLGLFAGVFNFVPYVGPLLTGVLLFLIIFPTEILKAVFVLAAFIIIQQIDNNVLSPVLMKKIVSLPPVLVIFALVVGAKLWGFLGSLLVVPLAGILFEFIKEFLEKRKEKDIAVMQ